MTDTAPAYVMDASGLTAWVRREPGADTVDGIIANLKVTRFVHAVNLCEVYYDSLRDAGKTLDTAEALATAQQIVADIYAAGIQLRDDLDPEFWQLVGQLKVNPGKISLADCFGLALAIRLGAEFVTSDHHELDAVAATGQYQILFIR